MIGGARFSHRRQALPKSLSKISNRRPIRMHTTKQLRASDESSDNARNSGGTVDGSSSRDLRWCTAERAVSPKRDSAEKSVPLAQ
jgi:hypothetical protein